MMSKITIRFALITTIASCLIGSTTVTAQQNTENTQVQGYSGAVNVIPNTARNEVTVVLTLAYTADGGTNQIVFHIQEAGNNTPPAWSGQARVLSGDGILAVVPQDRSLGLLFKFQELSSPTRFNDLALKTYPVYGIARFGEKKPLTSDQINQLATNGRISVTSASFDPDAFHFNSDQTTNASATPADEGPVNCVAGGPGSSSCGAGGCTVTCGGGYYACCQGGTCLCTKGS